MNPKELIKLFADSFDWDWKKDLISILSDTKSKVLADLNEHDVSYVLGTSEIQFYSTQKENIKTFGFQELIQSLKHKSSNEKVIWVTIMGSEWSGRCILSPDRKTFIGCAFVELEPKARLITPPKWDGSQKMLDEYNKNLP
jgi:hypothetical protein